jgi:hypothetical protein
MTMEQVKEDITNDALRLKELSNANLIERLDSLSIEFEKIKNEILTLTYQLDSVEGLYNKFLKEYQSRGNV